MRATESLLSSISKDDLKKFNENELGSPEMIRKATILLEEYDDVTVEKIDVIFNNDVWIFKDLLCDNIIKFDFTNIDNSLKFINISKFDELFIVIKVWISEVLSTTALATTYSYYRDVFSALAFTNLFDISFKERFISNLKQNMIWRYYGTNNFRFSEVLDSTLADYISHIISFIKFYRQIDSKWLIELELLYSKLDKKYNNRKLPEFRVFAEFHILLQQWYEESKLKENVEDKLKYLPLILWYSISSIIPMRPSEFCLIKKNAIKDKDGKYYLTFPRLKYRRIKSQRKKIPYDTIFIPNKIKELFYYYLKLTDNNVDREFMIDYDSFMMYSIKKDKYDNKKKFNRYDLNKLIYNFYIEYINKFTSNKIILNNDIDIYIESSENELSEDGSYKIDRNYVLAGDLRHIAIINMMMQGYSEIQIERLAGHFNKETQMNYASHAENWMNIEVLKIQNELRKYKSDFNKFQKNLLIHPKTNEFINNLMDQCYINVNNKNVDMSKYTKLKIGYCTDEYMSCSTFNWKHSGCYLCKYWIIDENELENNRYIIEKDLNLMFEETKEKINFLYSLYKVGIKDHIQNHEQVTKATVEEIKSGIYNIAKLRGSLGGLHE